MGASDNTARRFRMLVALVSSAAAVGLRWALPPELMPSPFLPHFGAVILSASYGGLYAGVVAGALGAAATLAWFPPPPEYATARLELYALVSLSLAWITSWFNQQTRNTVAARTAELRQANDSLREEIAERGRAETALFEERNFVAALFDTVGAVVVVLDREGRIVRLNHACEQLIGYREDEVRGWPFLELLADPEESSDGVALFQKLLSSPLPAENETYWSAGRGERRRILWTSTRLQSETGDYIIGSGVDVTERRTIEATLRESEERFSRTFANAPTGMTILSPQGKILQINDAMQAMLGYTQQELAGLAAEQFLHPDDIASSRHDLATLATGSATTYRNERRLRHRDGTLVWTEVSASAVHDEQANTLHIVTQHQDITIRKRAEAELRESEAKFRALAETAAAAILIYRGGDVLYANPFCEELLGCTHEEMKRMSPSEFIGADQQAMMRERTERRRRGEPVAPRYVVQIRRKNGDLRWVDVTTAHVTFGGDPAILGTAFDITDWRKAEEQVRQREAELAHVLRVGTVGQMAAGLAHEINQPLAAIVNYARGCTRRLDAGQAAPAEIREAVELIAAEAMRAGEVIRRLRQHLRKEMPRREEVDLNTLVLGALRFFEREAREDEVTLSLSLQPEPIRVSADPVQIEQVILNVLRNALESLQCLPPDGREICIRTRSGEQPEVVIEDNGHGFTENTVARIFDPFFTTKPAGLGLGLSISRSIIQAHGGMMDAESAAHGGARVYVRLPRAEESLVYVH